MMKRKKQGYVPKTINEIKIFILFLLDQIHYPMCRSQLLEIIYENCDDISLDYTTCIDELLRDGHICCDDTDETEYFALSESGHLIASELYGELDKDFREKALDIAIRHISLKETHAVLNSYIVELPNRRFRITMEIGDKFGEMMSINLTFSTREEAEKVKENFDKKPESVFRGTYFAATGRLEYVLNG